MHFVTSDIPYTLKGELFCYAKGLDAIEARGLPGAQESHAPDHIPSKIEHGSS